MNESKSLDKRIELAAMAIGASRHLVAFTGAGISVESGIPPFRGEGGLWESYDPSILDIGTFRSTPKEAWDAIKALFYDHWAACSPNSAHRVLAKWEGLGLLRFTITQNIDGLHTAAGTTKIAEYHGTLRDLVCQRCGTRRAARLELMATLPPRCEDCGGIFKPDFVFFGEGIPEEAATASLNAISKCDCLILVGTSGEVYPAAALPPAAKRRGATIVEVNPKPSAYTEHIVDYFIPLAAASGMERLDAAIQAFTP